jgi:anti-sigma B factor antagonist
MPALKLHRHDRGSCSTITLAGEIDWDTAPPVLAMVENALREGIRTIDIDLTALAFCDVSGLNAFLAVAARTAAAESSLYLHHPRPALIRLLALTDTDFLLHQQPLPPDHGTEAHRDRPAGLPQLSAVACRMAPMRWLARFRFRSRGAVMTGDQ